MWTCCFLLSSIEWLTYMRAHSGDLEIRKNLSLEIPTGPEIRPIHSSVIRRAYRETTARARKLYTGQREGRKTRGLSCWEKPQIHSKFPDDRVEHFARPHPVVTNVRPYDPDKLSVLAAHKAAFRMDRKWVEIMMSEKFPSLVTFFYVEKWIYYSMAIYTYINPK